MPFLAAVIPAIAAAGAAAAPAIGAVSGLAAGASGIAGAINSANAGSKQAAQNQATIANNQIQPTIQPGQLGQSAAQVNQGLGQQTNFTNALAAQGGIGNQSSVFGQEQGLSNQLGQMAQGAGPNPALAQLAQTTQANTANQAALMAGQRNAGSNAGLIARQAAMQGGANQQGAAGQAATLRAQQQLGAISALQQQQGMQAGLATTQVGQQQNALNAGNQLALQNQGQLLGAAGTQNAQMAGLQGQAMGLQGAQNQQQAGFAQQNVQGLASGTGAALVAGATPKTPAAGMTSTPSGNPVVAGPLQQNGSFAIGGMVGYAQGGQVGSQAIMKENYSMGPKSHIGRHFHKFAKGGGVHNMKVGGHVKGKAKVPGAKDSYANDTVKALLSPGEIVLPRSVTQSAEPIKNAAKFVAAVKAKGGRR